MPLRDAPIFCANSRLDPMPPCASITRSDSPTSSNLAVTTSMAARFSATNSTRLPSAIRAAIRLAITCDLPVPGGPQTTSDSPSNARLIALCWLESASKIRYSDSGVAMSGRLIGASLILAESFSLASLTPAIAATISLLASAPVLSARSFTIAMLVYLKLVTTTRGAMAKPGTRLDHFAAYVFSRSVSAVKEPGRSSAISPFSFETLMLCSLCRIYSSTGLICGSPDTLIMNSERAASVGLIVSGMRMTGVLGFTSVSTSQVASPAAANSVSIPFSSEFSCALR